MLPFYTRGRPSCIPVSRLYLAGAGLGQGGAVQRRRIVASTARRHRYSAVATGTAPASLPFFPVLGYAHNDDDGRRRRKTLCAHH
jgi:hypothetical protein